MEKDLFELYFSKFISKDTQFYDVSEEFVLENKEILHQVRIAYRTWGKLNKNRDNAILVFHGMTGSADVDKWWHGVLGKGKGLDPEKYFVVCSNVLGGCYGTTGPQSLDPVTAKPYLENFPSITIRDMVMLQKMLLSHLNIEKVCSVVGGSLGGMLALEWAYLFPEITQSTVPIATSAFHSAWCIGLNEVQRAAIELDPDWRRKDYLAGKNVSSGISIARMMAMCSYRTDKNFKARFGRKKSSNNLFSIVNYLRYHGRKLSGRFDANTYVALMQAMDSHDIGRKRDGWQESLRSISVLTCVVSITTDQLYFPEEQRAMHQHLPFSVFCEISSEVGHDAFLIETDQVSSLLKNFFLSHQL